MKTFHNNIGLVNPKLKKQIEKAETQQEKIYQIFKAYPKTLFTARDIEAIVKILLSSVHRSLSNLTDAGYIGKDDAKKDGKYGVVNGTWKLNK